ncbi:acyltransferase domain-containing protein, partial [Streptomyces sp. NPDC047821]|uniref:acyltransferase domain-containing protein n=1 Tax=Streptomyces sp. NPDC047821 TaxID=3365488 RepID=UPI0037247B18
GRLSIAAVNGPTSAVVSGDPDAIDQLLEQCLAEGIRARTIPSDCAGHSAQVDTLHDLVVTQLEGIQPRTPRIPLYSTVTGKPHHQPLDPAYWYRNLRDTVRFDQALDRLVEDGHTVFVEVSTHPVLGLPMADATAARGGVVAGTLARERGTTAQFLRNVALLHVHGYDVDWDRALGAGSGTLVPLPTYAFQRERYWAHRASGGAGRPSAAEEPFWRAARQGEASAVADLLDVPEELRDRLADLLPYLASWHGKLGEPSGRDGADRETPGGGVADRFRNMIAGLDAAGRLDAVVALLREETAVLLGRAPGEVPPSQALQQLGLDSLLAAGLRSAIARRTGVGVPSEVLLRPTGCTGIARYVLAELVPDAAADDDGADGRGAAAGTSASPWLRVLKPAGRPYARVLGIAGSGGTTDSHVPLIRHLPEGVELLGLQLPGREARKDEAPLLDAAVVADEVTAALDGRLDVPVVLYGHSQGTWLAWEIAHRLTRLPGHPPVSVVAACGLPPHTERPPELERLQSAEALVGSAALDELAVAFRGILPDALLANDKVLAAYVDNLRTDITMARNHEELLRSDSRAPLDVPLVAVGASLDPVLPAAVQSGWAPLTSGPFTLRTITGTHAAPIENPEAMAAELVAAIPDAGSGR